MIPSRFPQILSLFLLCLGCASSEAAAKKKEGDWETLKNCRLIPSFLNDGDSFMVQHDGEEFVVRLYYVDTAEVSLSYPDRVKAQADYFGITLDQTLALAKEGTEFTKDFLRGPFTIKTCWKTGGGHGIRYLVLIERNGDSLTEALVENGLARVYGYPTDPPPPGGLNAADFRETLYRLERKAKSEHRGGWGMDGESATESTPAWKTEPRSTPPPTIAEAEPIELSANALGATLGGSIDINRASAKELQSVPGIGSVLSQRIIAGRPWESLEALDAVKGISPNTVEKFRAYLYVGEAEPPQYTASYYQLQPERWRNRTVPVSIRSIEPVNWPAPDGFVAVTAKTEYAGKPGGLILVFLPEDRYQPALDRFANANEPLISNLYYYNYQGRDIFVVPR